MFNESFATAVERLGGARWLATEATRAARKEYAEYDGRRNQFRALALATRKRLEKIYEDDRGRRTRALEAGGDAASSASSMRSCARAGAAIRRAIAATTNGWNRPTMLRSARRPPTTNWCPASRRCSCARAATGTRFYDAVKRLAALPKDERHQLLKEAHDTCLPSARRARRPAVPDIHITRQHALGPGAKRASWPSSGPRRRRRNSTWNAPTKRARRRTS